MIVVMDAQSIIYGVNRNLVNVFKIQKNHQMENVWNLELEQLQRQQQQLRLQVIFICEFCLGNIMHFSRKNYGKRS